MSSFWTLYFLYRLQTDIKDEPILNQILCKAIGFFTKKNSSLTSNYLLFYSGEGDNIRVYVRVRPPDKHLETDVDRTPCLEVTSGNTIVLQSKPDPKNFSFDHVADINTTQVSHTLSQKLANKFCIFFLSPFVSCANFFVYFLQLKQVLFCHFFSC